MINSQKSIYLVLGVSSITAIVLMIGILVGGLVVSPVFNQPALASTSLQTATDTDMMAAYENTLVNVYRDVLPSVVNIRVTKTMNTNDFGGDLPQDHPEFFNQGGGSGFVWDQQGHIVTNNHVVEDSSEIEVYFADGTWADAELVATDPDSDLAVVKVDVPASELVPVKVGDSSQIEVGQLAIAIGNPFGQDFTMTSGIVSAIGRTIQGGNAGFSIPEVIQTDAPINPGNSGGPLVNRRGEVIGINAQMLSRSGGSSGIGFSIPVDIAKTIVPDLISGNGHEYSWLGISGSEVSPAMSEFRQLDAAVKGAVVTGVFEDGPAAKAGLQGRDESLKEDSDEFLYGGDIITAIDGTAISGIDDLISYLVTNTRPGDEVELTVIRVDGDEETVSVTLGTRPRE